MIKIFKLSKSDKNFLRCATIQAALYFYLTNVFYLDIGQNMGPQYFLPIFLPTVALLIFGQFAAGDKIFSAKLLPNLLTGLAWAITFPLLYTWTYNKPWFMSLICYDFIIGTAIFLLLTSLEVLLPAKKISAALLTLLTFFFWLIPFIESVYYCLYWHCLSPASLMAIYLTNWKESLDFIQSNFGVIPAIIILSIIFFLLATIYKSHKKFFNTFSAQQKLSAAVVLICSISAMIFYAPQTSMAGLYKTVTDYVAETQKYSAGHAERFANLKINSSEHPQGTIIFVIGESASRTYMHAYNKNFPFDNTPWLESKTPESEKVFSAEENDFVVKIDEDFKQTAENTPNLEQVAGNFIVYNHAYSSWSQTVPVLQRALTEQSQYNEKEFYNSISIIDAAKKAGYKTFWFSNQGRYGEYDSATTLVAKTADVAEWTDDTYDFSDKDDIVLLDFLKTLDPAENNFVVLHLMGSHIYYNHRYPKIFKKWTTADGTGMATSAAAYANTILYTDFVLSQFFDYARQNLNLQAMIYFSDHGENLKISHNPDVFSFDMVRIPMFIYLSPSYEKIFSEQTKNLSDRREEYFTNDLLYDTVCGILNAPSTNYDSTQDFSSKDYRFNRDNLVTMFGQQKISDDAED